MEGRCFILNLVEQFVNKICASLEDSLERAKSEGKINYESIPAFVVEVPREKNHGDFATNIAMLMAKEARKAPRQIAEIIVETLDLEDTGVEKVEIAGAGFINFYLSTAWLHQILPIVAEMDTEYGTSHYGSGRKVQVEFVSANPTGLLHMGNARGAALGDSSANLLKTAGYQVSKEYYINDTGNQIENLGKSLESIYLEKHGINAPFPEEGYHGEDLKVTVDKFIEKYSKKYVDTAADLRRERLIEYALEEKLTLIRKGLENFGVNYDVWFSEQILHDSGELEKTISILKDNGYVYEKEGALWFESTRFGDEKDEVLVRSNGIPTYFAADIAYHKNKFERGFDWAINVWGADHHGHVNRMKGAMEAIGYKQEQLHVILMQLVRLFRGGEIVRMSKRSGQYVTLQELIEEVGADAARYFFVMRSADSHLDFDLDLAKSQSQENPVYYVQYAHARICSIIRQAQEGKINLIPADKINYSLLTEEVELALIRKIMEYPELVVGAAKALEPHRLTKYAHELASSFHSFYTQCRVLNTDEDLVQARLALVNSVRITLRNVLKIIGIKAPERM
ncbi:MAG: arginine--tRNA ligase [Desulfitibacter sp. BRH_c19]|nr:MAG: arginine--tRNA ligase [Desulfitibacter sp. BRH_c19]